MDDPPYSSIEKEKQPGTILVVDDHDGFGFMLTAALSLQVNEKVCVVPHAKSALEAVQQFTPSLLIIDCLLPEMSGLELYDRLHAMPGFETIPAIMLSASFEMYRDEIHRRHLVGFAKPFKLVELYQAINQVLCSSSQTGSAITR